MSPPLVVTERAGTAAILRLNRPEKRNALSRSMVAAIGHELSGLAADPSVRAIILTGAGPAFCSGLDLVELQETLEAPDARDRMRHDARQLAAVFRALATSIKPTIAAVNGPAVAGGAGLATACDLAVASPTARFGYPEVRRGILPAIITPLLLRTVSARAARFLLLTGNLVEAAEAADLGVYNRLAPHAELMATALSWAGDIARGGPATLASTKQWIDRSLGAEDLWVQSADASALARFTPECHEGAAASREQRPPSWVPSGLEPAG